MFLQRQSQLLQNRTAIFSTVCLEPNGNTTYPAGRDHVIAHLDNVGELFPGKRRWGKLEDHLFMILPNVSPCHLPIVFARSRQYEYAEI